MFIRRKKLGERTLVQIVESCRHEGKPRRRVRKHAGTAYGEERTVSLERHAEILMQDLARIRPVGRHFSMRGIAPT